MKLSQFSSIFEICLTLLQADVRIDKVREMLANIKNIHIEHLAASHDKAMFDELCKMLDPGKVSFAPKKGEKTVVMFVGLQGSRKTKICAKYAYYHQKKGWKPALVSADTYSAGGFDQLMQNAIETRIPFHGSFMESDPASVAVEGVERFRKQNCDLIIIDTSGRHKTVAALSKEIHQVSEATKPDLVIFVIDSSIGHAAFDQALAFKQIVGDRAGAVIVTKLDSHSKGLGTLSVVTATNVPLIFLETGENLDEFDVFNVKRFVSHLLGKGKVVGFMEKVCEHVPVDQQPKSSQYSLRTMYCHLQSILIYAGQGSTLPGDAAESLMLRGCKNEGHDEKIKCYLTVLKSIIGELDGCNSEVFRFRELDSFNPNLLNYSHIMRIAKCSGHQVREVMEILEDYKRLAKVLENTMKVVASVLD